MQCPLCNVELLLSDRQGIEIDYCPKCRGIWLDRGELDKLIERTSITATSPPTASLSSMENHNPGERFKHRGDAYNKGDYKRKKSLFHDIFDF